LVVSSDGLLESIVLVARTPGVVLAAVCVAAIRF
jgi:hypothetical protein